MAWQIAGAVLGLKVTPTLKGAPWQDFGANDLWVKNQPAAQYPVFAAPFFQCHDPLPGQNRPAEHPVKRSAIQQLIGTLGPHTGYMARDMARNPPPTFRLPTLQVLNRVRPDAKLYQIDESVHITPKV